MQERREICSEIARSKKVEPNVRIAATLADAKLAGELVEKSEVDHKRHVLTPERRKELLRLSMERDRPAPGAN